MKDFLDQLVVVDFTHRLPGPMATLVLSNLGAQVYKVEDETLGDSFQKGPFAQIDESFPYWYEELNRHKKIVHFDFKHPDIKQQLQPLLKKAHIILVGPSLKLRQKLGITQEELEKIEKDRKAPFVVVELLASKNEAQAMHDINALAACGLLPMHLADQNKERINPPFLPLAGITFGHSVATQAIAAWNKAKEEGQGQYFAAYLLESTQEIYAPFWPKKLKDKGHNQFLHNGLYPCYNLYRLKDGHYVALAAVEEKFWQNFTSRFSLKLSLDDRFYHQDQSVFKVLEEMFASKDTQDINHILNSLAPGEELCLNLAN